ncbi:MAG TPA: single-stranded-DNA-specific exonuclease RecJ, partial [Verrucomicrobiae bacterium]|nr:single-stranded-DNA-specific exonuclease RecJ [Verrucomicrobiae bacterium]
DPAAVDLLSRESGLSPLASLLLVHRGHGDPASASRFLSPSFSDLHDPFLMHGMAAAVERLAAAARRGEQVCVYGDYDVDGITSTALLVDFFRAVGIRCFYRIPLRMEEGYGLSEHGIRSAVAGGAAVIVTVDCGVSAVQEAELCRSLGVDLIITDHHTPGPVLPRACAVINPHIPACSFPFKLLAGVGVAFNLAIALRTRLREEGLLPDGGPNLRRYLDLVALGTIADIVPLVDENRIFVTFGLQELSAGTRVGVGALKGAAGVLREVTCGAVGFRLAPRINACGRLEDASAAVELLLTSDPKRAAELAGDLEAGNAERQALEQAILRDALLQVGSDPRIACRKSIVLSSDEWHPGVIGIVASRIVDMYHRPTVLIAFRDGSGKGSGRSIPAFHLHDALCACADHLVKFGGHKYAAGLSIDQETLEAFICSFDEIASGLLSEEDLIPEVAVDAEVFGPQVTADLVRTASRLEPFGPGNPEPVFLLRNARVQERRLLKDQHLKLAVSVPPGRFDAIGFNMAERRFGDTVDILFSPQFNEWNGKKRLQLRLRDIRDCS